ncbi:FMN-dependent dehydrogenase-domain-containing protein [Pholiota molesta]|nr:FMN-dependent dehydrogenase-domain-containing protein [Pholiota molesta]
MAPLTLDQVAQHNSKSSCWVIIQNKVYDVTEFLDEHPGGAAIILKYAGRDATAVYEPIHPPDALDNNLESSKHLGPLEAGAADSIQKNRQNVRKTADELRVEQARKRMPPLDRILSLSDMENVARQVLSHKALAYYSSASDDEITNNENARAFARFFFQARVMRRVSKCDPSTTILGFKSSIPVFVSGAALAKLGHPEGEANITRGAFKGGIIQMVSSNASLSPKGIMEAADQSQTLFFQLYKHRDDDTAEKRVRDIEQLGYKAIFLTVDAVVPGNRERDIRSPWVLEEQENGPVYHQPSTAEMPQGEVNIFGTAGALIANDDRDMTWEKTIPWLRRISKLPIVIKGLFFDAVLAADAGVDGILISNHGGKSLFFLTKTSLPPMEILYLLRLQRPDIFNKLEGGISRGTGKVIQCTNITYSKCKAVGLGRPFLYAQSAYGAAGVSKMIEILAREITTAMRLVGASSIDSLRPEMIHRIDWQPVSSKL